MVFEVGKTYKHSSGKVMKIQGKIHTETFGDGLLGEDLNTGELIPVGETEKNFIGWREIPQNPVCVDIRDVSQLKKIIGL